MAPRKRDPDAGPRIGAFFDMDKTILSENSGTLFVKYQYEKGELGTWDLVKGLGAYLRYKAGVLDIDRWTKDMMAGFKGQSELATTREANRWFKDAVAPTIYPEAYDIVRDHHEKGHVVAIVSGATRFVVRPLAALSEFCRKVIDGIFVEGAVHTGPFLAKLTGDLFRFTTTGNVRNYLLYFFAGLLVLFWWVVL